MKARLLTIPLASLDPPSKPLREHLDPDALAEMADSLTRLGQLQPIRVKREGDRWRVQVGHRRYEAAKRLQWTSLLALEAIGNHVDDLEAMVAENAARVDLTPWEEAQAIHDLVVTNGSDVDQIAKAFGKSRAWVDRRLDLYSWPEDIRAAVHKGTLGLAPAAELAHVHDPGYREYLLRSAISGGCTATTARLWRTEWESRGGPTMAVPLGEAERPAYLPPPAAGLACSSCGVLTLLQDLKTLHVCHECLKPKEDQHQ